MNNQNKLKIEKKIIFTIVFVFFMVSFVGAIGITQPQPQNIELKPGQSSFFTLQVQADDFALTCVPIIRDTQGLELAFNTEYHIEPNQDFNIKPQVIVPKETPLGFKTANFCLECSPSGDLSGSKVIPVICNLPVTVDVVTDRTRENRFEDTGQIGFIVILAFLSIAIVFLALTILYLVKRRRRS